MLGEDDLDLSSDLVSLFARLVAKKVFRSEDPLEVGVDEVLASEAAIINGFGGKTKALGDTVDGEEASCFCRSWLDNK